MNHSSLYTSLINNISTCSDKKEHLLKQIKFDNPETAWKSLEKIFLQVDFPKLFPELFPEFLTCLTDSFDPSRGLSNFERFSDQIYDKNYLYTILNNNRRLLKVLLSLFSGSQYLTDFLLKNPSLFDYLRDRNFLYTKKTKDQMQRELTKMLDSVTRLDALYSCIRKFKKLQFLRIGLRDLLRLADLVEIMQDITNVAEVCLQSTFKFCESELIKKFGVPTYTDETGAKAANEFCIIGMGKLGGKDLNFSSDIDLLYIYRSEKGKTKGSGIHLSNHEFYVKLATMITKAINDITEHGNIFRVDLGLRPEGASGAIVSSIRSHEIYYESWGQTWERQALIKARTVAGSKELGDRFCQMTTSFIYRKYLDISAIDEIKKMKDKINQAMRRKKDSENDVKLGKGGIREIEFVVQVFQLLYGGKDKRIRKRNTLEGMRLLLDGGYIPEQDYSILIAAYRFLRELEHRIQISFALQTHKIPENIYERSVLVRKMGLLHKEETDPAETLMKQYIDHTSQVQEIYNNLLSKKNLPEEDNLYEKENEQTIDINNDGTVTVSPLFLDRHNFTDNKKVIKNLSLMCKGDSIFHPSVKTKNYFASIVRKIILLSAKTPDPDQAINNMEKFTSSSKSNENLFLLLLENEHILAFLLSLFGSSNFLADILIFQPDLIDTLFHIDGITTYKTKHSMMDDLISMVGYSNDPERFLTGIRKFKKGEILRIGLKHITGKAGLEGTTEDMTSVAEVCLVAALKHAEMTVRKKHGIPYTETNEGQDESKFSIIGMGKLGGYEIDFGSDLDLIFIYSGEGYTSGVGESKKGIVDNHFYFTKVCELLFQLIAEVRKCGYAYKIDSRLRPEGKKGLLVVSLDHFEHYLLERGETWEKQALVKARPVAGSKNLGLEILNKIHAIIYKAPFKESTFIKIDTMRKRMEQELGKEKKGKRDIKVGAGGLIDIEFIAQVLQLKYGIENKFLRSQNTLTILDELTIKGIMSPEHHKFLKKSYRFYRKIQLGLRIENMLSKNTIDKSLTRLSKLLKYKLNENGTEGEQLMKAYSVHAAQVRQIYKKIFLTRTHS